jgi:PepSY-associated TM region
MKSKNKDSKIVKKIKQKMYKWHRTLGIITVIPVILWILSGCMHPFMAHFFKPQIAHEKLETTPLDTTQIKYSIQEVLSKNKIQEFKNFRIVNWDTTTYYQVKSIRNEYQYYNAYTAQELKNGDKKYAEYLSRYFLDDKKSALKDIELITEFTAQYKYINRYLPVYKVTFNRDDCMQIYVETSSSKLATYNPKSRQIFIWLFDTFHNWSFIDWIANNTMRIIAIVFFLSILLFTSISGLVIYGFLWKKFKKSTPVNPEGFLKKRHRSIGIMVSFLIITFAFSGAFHALQKWQPTTLSKMVYEPIINTNALITPSTKITTNQTKIVALSVIKFKDDYYYQCEQQTQENEAPEVYYINATNNTKKDSITLEYAKYLGEKFAKMEQNTTLSCCEMDEAKTSETNLKLKSISVLTQFDKREYGFVNKRLPVVKLEYNTNDNTTYYIETTTSRLAAVVNNNSRLEGYSFAIFHKFLLLEWAGKNIRDFITVLAALGISTISILGLILFIKRK